MVKIKICGLKRLEDIEIVNKYEPDYIGFVFADSKRKVSHDLALKMKSLERSQVGNCGHCQKSLIYTAGKRETSHSIFTAIYT